MPATTPDPLALIAAAVGVYRPSRCELLQLAKMQAGIAITVIEFAANDFAGNVRSAKALLTDALDYLNQAEGVK